MAEFWRFDYVAQGDGFAMDVGNFDADGGFAGDAFDQDGFGLQREAEIVAQVGDAAVFDAGFGLEFESGDDRAGIDLGDVAADVEFHALGFDGVGALFQLVLVHFFAALGIGEERGRGQLVSGLACRDFWLGGFFLRGRRSYGFVFVEFDDRGSAAGVVAALRRLRVLPLLRLLRLSSLVETRWRGTGGRPAILISSTRLRRRSDSRASRQSFTRAHSWPR